MAGEQVHQGEVGPIRVILTHREHLAGKQRGRLVGLPIIDKALVIDRAKEALDGIAEAIVHGTVSRIAIDVGQDIGFLPQLAQHDCIGFGIQDHLAEVLPETGREGRIGHHIQTPAIRAQAKPVARNRIVGVIDQVHHCRLVLVEHRDAVEIPPRIIGGSIRDARGTDAHTRAGGYIMEGEPVAVD